MSKKQHITHKTRHRVTILVLLIASAFSFLFTANAYVGNSKQSKHLYDNLAATDAAGGDVEQALKDLRVYIYSHMNTTIGSPTGVKPPIQLKGTYDRLVASEQSRVKLANDDLYARAQKECERLIPDGLSGRGRIDCITNFVSTGTTKAQIIPEGLYKYDFVSPRWSPDVAGIGMLVTAALGLALLYNVAIYRRLLFHGRISS